MPVSFVRRPRSRSWLVLTGLLALSFVSTTPFVSPARAADPKPVKPTTKVSDEAREQAIARAINFLSTKGQAANGSFAGATGPGVTALVTTAVLRSGRTPQDPLVAKSLQYLQGFVQPDGGIYQTGSRLSNYETCLAVVCFAAANRDGKYTDLIRKADKYVKGLPWNESSGHDRSKVDYGGAGYGKESRPDLSNTAVLLDALQAAGNGADDPAVKNALIFVSRCQNLETEHNTTEFSAKNPDGGFYYTPIGEGGSPAGKTANGGLRSYGSMTYAGLKSMIYAGLTPEDPRVKAALDWLKQNYTFESNPGLGDAGLFYYYSIVAKALDALGKDSIVDASGVAHNWRNELAAELLARQRPDGSWANQNAKWMEGDASLSTGLALMALSYTAPAPAAK